MAVIVWAVLGEGRGKLPGALKLFNEYFLEHKPDPRPRKLPVNLYSRDGAGPAARRCIQIEGRMWVASAVAAAHKITDHILSI